MVLPPGLRLATAWPLSPWLWDLAALRLRGISAEAPAETAPVGEARGGAKLEATQPHGLRGRAASTCSFGLPHQGCRWSPSLGGLAHADLNDSRTAPRDGEVPQPPSAQGQGQQAPRFTSSSCSMCAAPYGDLTLELKETQTLPSLGVLAHADLNDSPAPRTAPRDGEVPQPAVAGPGPRVPTFGDQEEATCQRP